MGGFQKQMEYNHPCYSKKQLKSELGDISILLNVYSVHNHLCRLTISNNALPFSGFYNFQSDLFFTSMF